MASPDVNSGVVQAFCPGCGAPQPVQHDFRELTCPFCQRQYLLDEATLRAFRQSRKQRRGRRKRSARQIEKSLQSIDDTWLTGAAIFVCFIYLGIGVVSALLNELSFTPLAARMGVCIVLTAALATPAHLVARWRLSRFWNDMPAGSRQRLEALSRMPREEWTAESTAEVERLTETAKEVAKRNEAGCASLALSFLIMSTPLWTWWVAGVLVRRFFH